MTATRVLRFGAGFVLEPASFEHKPLAEQWTAWDPDHAGKVDPRFWLEQACDRDSYLASDGAGPVLFFKVIVYPILHRGASGPSDEELARVKVDREQCQAELHMQFMPQNLQSDYERVRAMLLAGCPWLEQLLLEAGVEEIVFDSKSPALVAFTTKRLGFSTKGDGVLRKRLTGQPAAANSMGGRP